MRRVLLASAVSCAVLSGTAAPSHAACEFPKGWYTSQAELRYATDLYSGKLEESLATPSNTANLVGGNLVRTQAYASALSRYVATLPDNAPSC